MPKRREIIGGHGFQSDDGFIFALVSKQLVGDIDLAWRLTCV